MSLPQPDDLTSLVLRTDFSDDARWEALRSALDGQSEFDATFVSDPNFADATVQALVEDAAAAEEEQVTYLFLADLLLWECSPSATGCYRKDW
ncbi:DUF6924 domain-containing protein [Actinomadura sp. 6N118]|uniref:DUF6924 domain-containing protein n=1 Tax=Actinomadura sp. 6N118 TaxID=3375151 RepID=UPI003789EF7B